MDDKPPPPTLTVHRAHWMRRVAFSLLFPLVMTILGTLVNHFLHHIQKYIKGFDSKLIGIGRLGTYETQIAQNIVDPKQITERMTTIGGLQQIKDAIRQHILVPLKYAKLFFKTTTPILRPSRGVLLCGPPGTGKTMLARAIAAEANCTFLNLTLSSLENKYFGESSKLLGAAFSLARKTQPCILFFDEIDGMLRTRSDADQSCVYGFKTELLNNMDGLNNKQDDAIIVIGCTNCVDRLDPAVKRRLPRVYHVDLPIETERLAILKLITANEANMNTSLKLIAEKTPNYSGSDLANLYNKAAATRMHLQYQNGFEKHLETALDVEDLLPHISPLQTKHWLEHIVVVGDEEAPPDKAP